MPIPHTRAPHRRLRAAFLVLATAAAACGPSESAEADRGPRPEARIEALLSDGGDPVLSFPTGDTVHLGEDVAAFYRQRDFRPAWTDDRGLTKSGRALLASLANADDEGLPADSYPVDLLDRLAREVGPRGDTVGREGVDLGDLDILASEAFVRYTTDLRRGFLDPSDAGLEWRIERGDSTDAALLDSVARSPDVVAALDALRPTPPYYQRLREARARYDRIRMQGGWPTIPGGDTLEEGMEGPRVALLRERLVTEGDEEEAALARTTEPGERFDRDLRRAVELFQDRHGIDPDGAVGGSTLRELNVPVEERVRQIDLNLDRWRWLPRELGERYVVVNVAGFEAAVVEGDSAVYTTDVVVGERGWETDLFRDTLEYVVVNPYWNVPESIKEEDILPKYRENPDYLAENRLEVVNREGEVVHPDSVPLGSEAYRLRQLPGSDNSLGEVKFLFPNDYDIYLHDTPARSLFDKSTRAFSHGCIRVEKPFELARYLFRTATSSYSPEDFDRMRRSGEEEWVQLDDRLPVYVLYFTAWVDEEENVHFYRDVYGRDARVRGAAP